MVIQSLAAFHGQFISLIAVLCIYLLFTVRMICLYVYVTVSQYLYVMNHVFFMRMGLRNSGCVSCQGLETSNGIRSLVKSKSANKCFYS